jgi:two-component system KDP operon response regulator KdpE
MMNKVLVVDDDTTLLRFIREYLEKEGFQVAIADRGQKALRQFYQERPEIVLLDVMMPGMDGWEVCARLKELADVPIILLTAKTAEADKLRGFRLGVDDYITKPFSMAEIVARINAVLARTRSDDEKDVFIAGVIAVDMLKREARIENRVLDLTPTEFRLLATLARRSGEAVSQDDLITDVWGEMRVKSSSALRRYIWLLRRKIEPDPENPTRLKTVRGYGYRLET